MLTVILSGGASRRMGRDKATLPYGGSTLLQTLIDRYAALGDVGVSVNEAGRFAFRGAAELPDPFPDGGPMNGIIAGFRRTAADALLLTAVDLPYGDVALALRLDALRGDADACLIRRGVKGIEPLFAVYGRACLAAAEACMAEDRRAMRAMLDRVNVRWVTPGEIPEFDLDRIFLNVNTPEEYRALHSGTK